VNSVCVYFGKTLLLSVAYWHIYVHTGAYTMRKYRTRVHVHVLKRVHALTHAGRNVHVHGHANTFSLSTATCTLRGAPAMLHK